MYNLNLVIVIVFNYIRVYTGLYTSLYIYIYIIIGETEKNSNYNSKLEFQSCAMYLKLFILKVFYFLILESNVGPHHKYSSK